MKIKWMGKINEKNPLPSTKIPCDAVQFLNPPSNFQLYIPIIPISVLVISAFYIRINFIQRFHVNFINFIIGCIVGTLLSFVFLFIHELLHAICLPCKSEKFIFFSNVGFTTIPSVPISKLRYIIALVFPVIVLGFIPLFIWIFIPLHNGIVNILWFIFASGNIGASTNDFYNLVHALKEMPQDSLLQTSGNKCYYFRNSEHF